MCRLFHPRLIGLTGDAEANPQGWPRLQGLLRPDTTMSKQTDRGIDHTAYMYLMGRDGRYLGFFPPGTSADRMVEIIRPQLAALSAR